MNEFTSKEFELAFWNKTSGGFFNVVVHATVYQRYRLTSRFQSISYVMREKDSKAQSFHPPGPFPIHRAHGGGKFLIVTLLRPTFQVALSPRAKFREIIGGCPTFRHGFLIGIYARWKIFLAKIIFIRVNSNIIVFRDDYLCNMKKKCIFTS